MEHYIWQAISIIFGILTALLGNHLVKVKELVKDIDKERKEINDVFEVAKAALADKKITPLEAKNIFKEIVEAKEGFDEVIDDLISLFKKK